MTIDPKFEIARLMLASAFKGEYLTYTSTLHVWWYEFSGERFDIARHCRGPECARPGVLVCGSMEFQGEQARSLSRLGDIVDTNYMSRPAMVQVSGIPT